MTEEKLPNRLIEDFLARGDALFSQLVAEAESINVLSTVDPNVKFRRNEILLKIEDQMAEINRALENVDIMQKQLKKNLNKLRQLRKILCK